MTDRSPTSPAEEGALPPRTRPQLPVWPYGVLARATAVLAVGAVLWFSSRILLRVGVLVFSLLVAVLIAAMVAPGARRLRRAGMPPTLTALTSVVVVLGVPAGVGYLVYTRVRAQVDDLRSALTSGIDDVRSWLTTGPLSLDPSQVDRARDALVGAVSGAAPTSVADATSLLSRLAMAFLSVFAVFFLVKDGNRMWQWFLSWVPTRRRDAASAAGERAWSTLERFVVGMVAVAFVDAVGIGVVLLVLGVPLWLSLALLVFLAAFVPIIGATVSGAAAVLVTLVTNGVGDAIIVLVAVLVVQQLEGNVLQPLIMGRAVALHPLVILVAVTAGTLTLGIAGALLAVPTTAVGYAVVSSLRDGASERCAGSA